MTFTEKEIQRYSRHLLLDQVGVEGQEKLKQAKVLIIGAGGLGCPALQYLAAAGVGTIGIMDFDNVDASNLQRQVLFEEQDIGKNKALAAQEKLGKLNSLIQVIPYTEKLSNNNALQLFASYDLIVDCSDNFATRYLVNDACILSNKPFVYGAISRFEGQVSVFNHREGPSYRCLFPDPPSPEEAPNCAEIGVLGVLPGIIGSYQAAEAIKIILNIGEPLSGKLKVLDLLTNQTTLIQIRRVPDQIDQVLSRANSFETYDYEKACGVSSEGIREITAEELMELIRGEEHITLVDVREAEELPKMKNAQVTNIPLGTIDTATIDKGQKTIVFCQTGVRSKKAINLLQDKYGHQNLWNLKGGALAWIAAEEASSISVD